MSTLKLGIATCRDLQNLYENSEYADRIGEYEILERFAQAFGLNSSEYESITDRCPTAKLINNLKDNNNKQYFNITKRGTDGKIIYELNQLVEYYYTQAICLSYGCTSDGVCSSNTCTEGDGCSGCDSNIDDCGSGEEVCDDSEFCGSAVDCPDDGTSCEEDGGTCDGECNDCFGTESKS